MRSIVPKKYRPQAVQFYINLRSLKYLGYSVVCPCCNGHFRKFLPYGDKPRPNALCPKCGSVERHRLLWIYLKDKTNFFKDNLKVLDIAPMRYFQLRCATLPNLDYISADISSSLAMLKMDITNIPLRSDQFDCIICYHVLEHIPDDHKAMRELYRVLKSGGWAILQSPVDFNRSRTFEDPSIASPEERDRVFGQYDHVRIYGKDYKDRLENAGFAVKVDNYVQQLGDATIRKYGLTRNEEIYFSSKTKDSNDHYS